MLQRKAQALGHAHSPTVNALTHLVQETAEWQEKTKPNAALGECLSTI